MRSERVFKVGVHIKADFTKLFKDCGFKAGDPPFAGAVELGQLAKARNAADRSNVSLQKLVEFILRQHLPKDTNVRISKSWEQPQLSPQHITYASVDAYATWAVFDELQTRVVGTSSSRFASASTSRLPAGTPVRILSRDKAHTIGFGNVAQERPRMFKGVNVTKTREVVTITSVLVPACLIPGDLLVGKAPLPLSSFGQPPFDLLYYSKCLQVCSANTAIQHFSALINLPPLPPLPFPSPPPTLAQISEQSDSSDLVLPFDEAHDNIPPNFEISFDTATVDVHAFERSQTLQRLIQQQNIARAGGAHPVSASTTTSSSTQPTSTPSQQLDTRVLGDIWHLMHMFQVPVHHGMRRPFFRALRDAMMLHDPGDKALVTEVLKQRKIEYDSMVFCHSDWVFARVRRYVPPPDELLERVMPVLLKFGPIKDATTEQPLFNDAAWDKAANICESIKLGYYSDPPGITLYYRVGKDRSGLSLYRCVRGTNGVEGGIHQNIIRFFGPFNASPQLAVCLLRDYVLIHNYRVSGMSRICVSSYSHSFQVGTFNRTGKRFKASYDIWTLNEIAHYADLTSEYFNSPPKHLSNIGWVNGHNYEQTTETLGIMSLSQARRDNLGMLPYSAAFAKAQKLKHVYLALQQGTRIPVLPIHTAEEKSLFRLLAVQSDGHFSGRRQPDWIALCKEWSQWANGTSIFYKVHRQHLHFDRHSHFPISFPSN